MMLVEELQEDGFPALSRCVYRVHLYLNSITASSEKESLLPFVHTPQEPDLPGVVTVVGGGAPDEVVDLG
jgi:hypothetical protein